MNKEIFEIKKYESNDGSYMLTSHSGEVAIFFDVDNIYLGTLFGCNSTQIKDVALFMDYNADNPNNYLCNKYNIDPDDDIFGGVMTWNEWIEVLYDLDVITENQVAEPYNKLSLESALAEIFY
jgi:hypothetical protein